MPLNNQGIPPKVKLTNTVPNGHMVSPERLHSKVPESTTYGMMNVCLKSQMFLFVTVSLSEEKKKKKAVFNMFVAGTILGDTEHTKSEE